MTASGTQIQLIDLKEITSKIQQGRWGLPEFQRPFIWADSDVRSLLATVLNGWPAGSLLLLSLPSGGFALRQVDGAPPLLDAPEFAVLDGQQRVTSLYQALFDAGSRIYGIKWDVEHDEKDDIEESILSLTNSAWEREYGDVAKQAAKRIIPFSALKSASHFFEWRDSILEVYSQIGDRTFAKQKITDLYSRLLSKIHDYRFPAVLLSRDVEPGAIARIFERVNRTGVRLSTFDLMVAKTFTEGWNLRDQWDQARIEYPRVSKFLRDDGLPILQAIALMEVQNLRQSAVLQLRPEHVRNVWDNVLGHAENAIGFLQARLGVSGPDMLPYPNMLPVLIAIDAGGHRLHTSADLIERWFWYCVFSGVFEVGANTRLVTHYRALLQGAHEIGGTERLLQLNLREAKKRTDKALSRAVMCYISATRVKDYSDRIEVLADDLVSVDLYPPSVNYSFSPSASSSVLNVILVPNGLRVGLIGRSIDEKEKILSRNDFGSLFHSQVSPDEREGLEICLQVREQEILSFLNNRAFGNTSFTLEVDQIEHFK